MIGNFHHVIDKNWVPIEKIESLLLYSQRNSRFANNLLGNDGAEKNNIGCVIV